MLTQRLQKCLLIVGACALMVCFVVWTQVAYDGRGLLLKSTRRALVGNYAEFTTMEEILLEEEQEEGEGIYGTVTASVEGGGDWGAGGPEVPVLTFYLSGEIGRRLASFAVGAAYASRHGFEFRALWELDEYCFAPLETIFQTVWGAEKWLRNAPMELLPTAEDCSDDITARLSSNRSISLRAKYDRLPLDNPEFRARARAALESLRLNPEGAGAFLPHFDSPANLTLALFHSASDEGLATAVEAASRVYPLINSIVGASLRSDVRARQRRDYLNRTLFVVASHRPVVDVVRAFHGARLSGALAIGRKPKASTLIAGLWLCLGLVPNAAIVEVFSASSDGGLLSPALLGLLPASVEHLELLPDRQTHVPERPESMSNASSGILYVINTSNKTFTQAKSNSAHSFMYTPDFHQQELARSVNSMLRVHSGNPLPMAAYSDAPLLNTTAAQLSHILPTDVTRTLANHSVNAILELGDSQTLVPKRLAKIKAMAGSPFGVTFAIDTDTMACASLRPCFSLLKNSDHDILIGREYPSPVAWNSGAILYRRSAATDLFFRLWEHLYLFEFVLPGESSQDQPALFEVIRRLEGIVKVGVLPTSCHTFLFAEDWKSQDITWLSLHSQVIPEEDTVRLFHNRHFHNETYYQSSDLCHFLNNDVARDRVFAFHRDGTPRLYYNLTDCQQGSQQQCSKIQWADR